MKIRCDICGGITEIKRKEKAYLDPTGDFVCSLPCVQMWITRNARLDVALREGYIYGSNQPFVGSRADSYYSCLLQTYFRSLYELCVAEFFFMGSNFSISYERIAFKIGQALYIPDFLLRNSEQKSVLLEVKGRWGPSQKTKLIKFRRQYPSVPLLVLPWTIHSLFLHKGLLVCL